jgi:hypothetical protein
VEDTEIQVQKVLISVHYQAPEKAQILEENRVSVGKGMLHT